jgi:VanZ family protein
MLLIGGTIVVLTLAPRGFRPTVGHVNLERLAPYVLLGLATGAGFPRRRLGAAVGLVVFACGLEYLQTFIPTRDGRVGDALVKSAGALVGIAGAASVEGRLLRRVAEAQK